VSTAGDWIGWSSYHNTLNGGCYSFTAINRNQYNKASRNRKHKPDPTKYEETYTLALEDPLGLEGNTIEAQANHIRPLLQEQESVFREKRNNKPPLGIEAVRRQNPFDRPRTSARKPRRRFACENKTTLLERLVGFRKFVGDYATVHEQFTTNTKTTTSFHNEWPLGSYPPSRWQPMGATDTG